MVYLKSESFPIFNKTVEGVSFCCCVVVFVSFKEGGVGGVTYIGIVAHIDVSRYGHYKLH